MKSPCNSKGFNIKHDMWNMNLRTYWCVLNVGNGWVAGGCLDDYE